MKEGLPKPEQLSFADAQAVVNRIRTEDERISLSPEGKFVIDTDPEEVFEPLRYIGDENLPIEVFLRSHLEALPD